MSDYTFARNNEDGKSVYITADIINTPFNPLFEAFKSKSFTKNDINLHFYILDILFENKCNTAPEITDIISKEYSAHFVNATVLDMPVVRLKLNEYVRMGLISSEKRGRKIFYCHKNDFIQAENLNNILHFSSETSPVGVVGSFMLDSSAFRVDDAAIYFKHHHFHAAIDSEIVLQLLMAIKQQKIVILTHKGREKM